MAIHQPTPHEPTRNETPTETRPRVVTYSAISVDGRMAVSPDRLLVADSRWPASESHYNDAVRLAGPQVILEGSGSFVTEDDPPESFDPPTLPSQVLYQDFVPEELRDRAQWFLFIDGRGRVRWQFKEMPGPEWVGWHLLVGVCQTTPAAYLEFLRQQRIPYLVTGGEQVDLAALLEKLRRGFGVETVVATAGGRLTGALLRQGLVDEIDIEVQPLAIGGDHTASLFHAPDLGPSDSPTQLRLDEVQRLRNGRILLRYSVLSE